jgi:hypothetical protein
MTLAARRRVLWAMLAAKLVGSWGLGWDIRWHVLIGRDSFWIAPHLMTYASVTATALLALGVLVATTWATRRAAVPPGSVRIAGLTGSPGFHLAWWGMALTILAAPIDDLWHRLFGIDVTLWSPPHLLGLGGAMVNTLGCLVIALEVHPRRSPAGRAALLAGAALLFGGFHVAATPGLRTAFLGGGLSFFTYPVIGCLLLTGTLVLAARLTGLRSAPVLVVAIALAAQASMLVVSDLGFALLRPVSVVADVIAQDPTSPIAVAHEMARRNGTTPGVSLRLYVLALLPAALAAAIDARRRWAAASLAHGGAVLALLGAVLGRSPALQHAVPSAPEIPIGAALGLAAALASGAVAARLAARWTGPPPVAVAGSPVPRALGETVP